MPGAVVGVPVSILGRVPVVPIAGVNGVVTIVGGMLPGVVGAGVPVTGMVVAGGVTCPPGWVVQPASSRAILVRQSRKMTICLVCIEGNRILRVLEDYCHA
jgi:hypothetical protein